jgi:hypothetical protein
MGLTKDLKRMSKAIKSKLGGFSGKRDKGFTMIHFWVVMFSSGFIGYLFYHTLIRKRTKISNGII